MGKNVEISDYQKQLLVGTILGDAFVSLAQNKKGASLMIEQSGKHKEYVEHLYNELKSLYPGKLSKRFRGENNQYINYLFKTATSPDLLFYRDLFYEGNKKVIKPELKELITDVSLAYWYMDDGSIKSKESKGMIYNTHGFKLEEVMFLIEILKTKFNLDCWERKQKNKKGEIQYQIYISGYSYEKFMALIEPYIIESMKYKLPPKRKTGIKMFTIF